MLIQSISSWQLVEYGVEGSIMLLQTCIDHLKFYNTDSKDVQLELAVASIFKFLLGKPNFSTVFCESLRNTEINEGTLENFSNVLHLSVSEKIGIGLALSDSENLDNRNCGTFQFLSGSTILMPKICSCMISFLLHLLLCAYVEPFDMDFLMLFRSKFLYGSDEGIVFQSCFGWLYRSN